MGSRGAQSWAHWAGAVVTQPDELDKLFADLFAEKATNARVGGTGEPAGDDARRARVHDVWAKNEARQDAASEAQESQHDQGLPSVRLGLHLDRVVVETLAHLAPVAVKNSVFRRETDLVRICKRQPSPQTNCPRRCSINRPPSPATTRIRRATYGRTVHRAAHRELDRARA